MNNLYNLLEQRFDELTPDWIVSTGKIEKRFGSKLFQMQVRFNNKIVRKVKSSKVGGKFEFTDFDFKSAKPDFVVMNKKQSSNLASAIGRMSNGEKIYDPYRYLGCKSGYYIELLGEYYHTGDFVRGLSKEEHENDIIEAYESAGAKVLLLWENDINERWEEVCKPRVLEFTENLGQEWIKSTECVYYQEKRKDLYLSLADAEYWKQLDDESSKTIVEDLVSMYSKLDYPFPDLNMGNSDLKRFLKWFNGKRLKPTRFGLDCASHFTKSIVSARVKGLPSKQEVWNDHKIMRKCIEWQLSNETGSHNANRFLSAMLSQSKFRAISNLHPSKIIMWLDKFTSVRKGGVFYDPCAGWGSRMLASHALGMKYRAIDANKELVKELNEMALHFKMDAKIIYGDSSNPADVEKLLGEDKIDIAFTSPPYYDKELYSDDLKQSINMQNDEERWYLDFFVPMLNNTILRMNEQGECLFNVHMDFKLELLRENIKYEIEDLEVDIRYANKVAKERLLKLTPTVLKNEMIKEDRDYIVCQLCNKRLKSMTNHLFTYHNIAVKEYISKFPNSKTVSEMESLRISNSSPSERGKYNKSVVYLCRDGRYVRKRDAWVKSWDGEPPTSTILDSSEVNIEYEKWKNKIEGIDYVVCNICGYKGKSITRHIEREHSIRKEDYTGNLICEKSSSGCKKRWAGHVKKEKRSKEENKTHKQHNLTKEILEKLYFLDLLSEKEIGKEYGLSDVAVNYYRKKWKIRTLSSIEKLSIRAEKNGLLRLDNIENDKFSELVVKHTNKSLSEMFGCSTDLIRLEKKRRDIV